MKPWGKLLLILTCCLAGSGQLVFSQCNQLVQSITYDTLIPGSGNTNHSIQLNQFNPGIGTLMAVNVRSSVSLNYGFRLKNTASSQQTYKISVGRYDYFSSTALPAAYSNTIETPVGSYTLKSGDSVVQPLYTVLYRMALNDSITSSVAPFLGSGKLSFSYTPITYTNQSGSTQYAYQASAGDTIRFSVTYYFCNTTILESLLENWRAVYAGAGQVKLSWKGLGPQQGIRYEVEKGSDPKHFTTVGQLDGNPDAASYELPYRVQPGDSATLYFRLKILLPGGDFTYSTIAAVELPQSQLPQARVYPNPARDYINLDLGQSGDWDLIVFTAAGAMVQQEYLREAATTRINFKSRLAAGVYFVKAYDRKTSKQLIMRFLSL